MITLFYTEHTAWVCWSMNELFWFLYLDLNSLVYTPYPRVNCLKPYPSSAHTYIAHIWHTQPPPRRERSSTNVDKTVQVWNCRSQGHWISPGCFCQCFFWRDGASVRDAACRLHVLLGSQWKTKALLIFLQACQAEKYKYGPTQTSLVVNIIRL